jgi:hypothetical protein
MQSPPSSSSTTTNYRDQYNFNIQALYRPTSEKHKSTTGILAVDVSEGILCFKGEDVHIGVNLFELHQVKITKKQRRKLPPNSSGIRIKYHTVCCFHHSK